MKNKLCVVAVAAILTACGGGNGNDPIFEPPASDAPAPAPAPTPDRPTDPAPAPAPATRTLMYQAIPEGASFESQLNAEGGNGWQFLSGMVFSLAAGGSESRLLFVKEGTASYGYEVRPAAATQQALLDELNAQGARGFVYAGFYTAGTIYRKANDSASVYSYRVLPAGLIETSTEALTQAEAQGAEGYYQIGGTYGLNGGFVRIYQKDSQGNATYDYEALASPATDAGFLAQIDAQGARGFKFKGSWAFSDGSMNVFQKDTSQAATFSYQLLDDVDSGDDFVAQANAQGANGSVLISGYAFGAVVKNLYYTPVGCSGLICEPRNPFGF